MGATGEGVGGRKTKELFDKVQDIKNAQISSDSLFTTELIFPVGLKFKNLCRDQNCSASGVWRRRGFLPIL